jgi:hypothetical protein
LVTVAQESQPPEKDSTDVSTKSPVDEGVVSLNTNKVLMLDTKLKIIQEHVAQGNKTTLETQKTRDEHMTH